jgi:hypothetical protein
MRTTNRRNLSLGLLMVSLLVAGAVFWFNQQEPLSPIESRLVGTWKSELTSSQFRESPFLHEYRPDRTVVRRETDPGQTVHIWNWRVERGVLVFEQQHSLLDQLINDPAPDIGRMQVVSVTSDELVLGTGSSTTTFSRARD